MAYIVTGYTGQPHVTAQDDAAFNRVAGVYYYFIKQKTNDENPMITVSGDRVVSMPKMTLLLSGIVCRLDGSETISLDVGASGVYRTDIICGKYTKEASTGIESFTLEVIKGTPTSSVSGGAPTIPTGDVTKGETCYWPLFSVKLYGNNAQEIKRVIQSVYTLAEITNWHSEHNSDVADIPSIRNVVIDNRNKIATNTTNIETNRKSIVGLIGDVSKQGEKVSSAVMKNDIVTQSFSTSDSTIPAGGIGELSVVPNKSGYRPLGIVGFAIVNSATGGTGDRMANVYRAYIASSGAAVINIRNMTASAEIKVRADVTVLFVKM